MALPMAEHQRYLAGELELSEYEMFRLNELRHKGLGAWERDDMDHYLSLVDAHPSLDAYLTGARRTPW